MPKVAFIGAGSVVFARNLTVDLLWFEALRDTTELVLMDIDGERLRTAETVARHVADHYGSTARISATTDRRAAVDGADYVVTMFQVGGYRPATVTDFEIPKRFGLRQTIADTLGVGGIMRGLRTIPVLLDLCREIEELAPDALLLQYVNPMVSNCWAIAEATNVRAVGLCHSVQHTARQIAKDVGVPPDELDYLCAGINHVAFYLWLRHQGEDVYPRLHDVAPPDWNRVRYELFRHFGYFVTESSEHFAEYTPWFIKDGRDDLIERFNVPLDDYLRRCEEQIESWHALREQLERGEELDMPVVADGAGLHPQRVGALPPQLAGLIRTNLNVHELVVRAALDRRREHVYHAAMLDPHTGAELSLQEIRELVDALLEAHGDLIPALV